MRKTASFAWLLACFVLLLAGLPSLARPAANRPEYFALRVYHVRDARQLALVDSFLEHQYVPALHAAALRNIGVFKALANDTAADKRIYVFIPFKTLAQWEKFQASDAQSAKANGGSYANAAPDRPAYSRVETILLKAFADMAALGAPAADAPKNERVYELRSYESASEKIFRNKVQMFNEGGEIKLFARLGFNAVFYGEVVFGAKMPNLMYMTTFANMAARDAHWKTFGSDAEWKSLSGQAQYQNNVSHIDSIFVRPTNYSDI